MQVHFYKSLWGMESLPLPEALERITTAGYDGFEAPVESVVAARRDGFGLKAIAMLFVESSDALKRGLDVAGEAGATVVNVHAGQHRFTHQQGCEFFESALDVVGESGLAVSFETHRGRLLYEPQSTADYLRRFPELRLTADFSHWTCVCESLLADQSEAVDLAIERTSLLHARVGHEEGPQVPDPRSPYWQGHVEAFEVWWDRIVDSGTSRGDEILRVDPEFGPPNYLWTEPSDGRPLADLWDVCLWMRDRLKRRWLQQP